MRVGPSANGAWSKTYIEITVLERLVVMRDGNPRVRRAGGWSWPHRGKWRGLQRPQGLSLKRINMPKERLRASPRAARKGSQSQLQFTHLLICKCSLMRTNVYSAIEFKALSLPKYCQDISEVMKGFVCACIRCSPPPVVKANWGSSSVVTNPHGFRKSLFKLALEERLRARFNGCLHSSSLRESWDPSLRSM